MWCFRCPPFPAPLYFFGEHSPASGIAAFLRLPPPSSAPSVSPPPHLSSLSSLLFPFSAIPCILSYTSVNICYRLHLCMLHLCMLLHLPSLSHLPPLLSCTSSNVCYNTSHLTLPYPTLPYLPFPYLSHYLIYRRMSAIIPLPPLLPLDAEVVPGLGRARTR